MICVLVEERVVLHQAAGFLPEPVGGDGLQQVAHGQLVGVCLWRGFYPPFFDEPQLQRRLPGRHPEDGCHIAAPYGIGDVPFGPVGAVLQPAVVGQAGTVAENVWLRHQETPPFGKARNV